MAAARRLKPVPTPEEERLRTFIVVDPDTGERAGTLGDHLQELHDLLAGAEGRVKGLTLQLADLRRDKDAEAEEDELWPIALRIFTYWKKACNHPNSAFDRDRFEAIAGRLKHYKGGPDKLNPYARAEELCRLAIDGAAFDAFTKRQPNGRTKRFDSIDLIFRNNDKFEDFCNRAPVPKGDDGGGRNQAAGPDARGADGPPEGSQQGALWSGGPKTGDEDA